MHHAPSIIHHTPYIHLCRSCNHEGYIALTFVHALQGGQLVVHHANQSKEVDFEAANGVLSLLCCFLCRFVICATDICVNIVLSTSHTLLTQLV